MKPKHSSRVILGIDPGFGRMGFGCIRVEGVKTHLVDVGVITTSGADFPARLQQIAEDVRALLTHHKPDLLVMERLYFAKNVTTAMRVAEARGVVLLLSAEHAVPLMEFTPAQIKKALTGSGNATKQGVQLMVKTVLKLTRAPRPDDAADALAIAITAATIK